MNEHERRVSDALAEYARASACAALGRWFAVYSDGERFNAAEWRDRASQTLRRAVIMAEANGVRCV